MREAKAVVRLCPSCGGGEGAVIHRQDFEPLDGHPVARGYDVVICLACGFGYADTPCTEQDLRLFYAAMSKYADRKAGSGGGVQPWDAARLAATAAEIDASLGGRAARVLDIGCANGGLLAALRTLGYSKVAGVDPAAACVEAAAAQGFEARVGVLGALPEFGAPFDGGFDCVTLSHVLEHVLDVGGAVRSALSVLVPGGVLYIEVPDAARYSEYLYAPFQDFNTEHINHFSERTLRSAMARLGLRARASGRKTFRISAGCEFSAVWGVFERGAAAPEAGGELAEALEAYVAHSSAMMAGIGAHVGRACAGREECIVWGLGQLAMKVFRLSEAEGLRPVVCVDSNAINHGKLFRGRPIVAPESIRGMEQPILITSLLHHRSIERQIEAMGLGNERVLLRPDPDVPWRGK
jgi:2-polyprenyl-3-methyl-5-hydroxy-6-metoxy-1,4-benzoquinol methylase